MLRRSRSTSTRACSSTGMIRPSSRTCAASTSSGQRARRAVVLEPGRQYQGQPQVAGNHLLTQRCFVAFADFEQRIGGERCDKLPRQRIVGVVDDTDLHRVVGTTAGETEYGHEYQREEQREEDGLTVPREQAQERAGHDERQIHGCFRLTRAVRNRSDAGTRLPGCRAAALSVAPAHVAGSVPAECPAR